MIFGCATSLPSPVPPFVAAAFVLGIAVGAAVAPGESQPRMTTVDVAAPPRRRGRRRATTVYPAEVLRVIDGDTFDARVRVWPGIGHYDPGAAARHRCGRIQGRCDEERRLRKTAYDALSAMLAEGGVTISRVSFDKYGGRVLADAATRRTADSPRHCSMPAWSGAIPADGARLVLTRTRWSSAINTT